MLSFVIWGGNFTLGIYHQKILAWHIRIRACILKGVISLFVMYHYYLYVRIVNYLILIIYIGITKAV